MIIISPAKNLNILPETHSLKLSEPFLIMKLIPWLEN